jgi:ligand-binding sensor domain-containing protein
MRKLVLFVLVFFSFTSLSYSADVFGEGIWTSFTMLRYVTSITQDDRFLYIGTTGGVSRYNKFEGNWELPFTTTDGLLDNWVRNIAYDPEENEIVVKTSLGVSLYDLGLRRWSRGGTFPEKLSRNDTSSIEIPATIFMDFGYSLFPEGYVSFRNREYRKTAYLMDDFYNNIIWIGTWGLNIGKADLREMKLDMLKYGLYDSDVETICLDGDDIWMAGGAVGFQSRGITKYNPKNNTWEYFDKDNIYEFNGARINVIRADQRNVWFGTEDGLLRYNKTKNEWKKYNIFKGLADDFVTALKIDENFLFIGTKNGISFLNLKNDSLGTFPSNLVRKTYVEDLEADQTYLWAATDFGVFRMSKQTGDWFRFVTPDGILNGPARDIFKKGDELWFATRYGILQYNTITQKRGVFDSPTNYPGTDIFCMAVDDSSIWAGTSNGVWRYQRSFQIWKHYGREDGLLHNDIQAMALDGDYVWFGTPLGLTRFYWNNPWRLE